MHHKWHLEYLLHDPKTVQTLSHKAALSNFMTYGAFGPSNAEMVNGNEKS